MNVPLAPSPKPTAARPRVAVIQDGARLHYAVPVALKRAGLLEVMFTQWFARRRSVQRLISLSLRRVRPALGRRMAERRCDELNDARVVRSTSLTLREMLARRRFDNAADFYIWQSEQVRRWVMRRGLGDANMLMGFVLNIAPGLCADARQRGLLTVGDQIIAPVPVMLDEAQRQHDRWPGWEPAQALDEHAPMLEQEAKTWPQLDHVTCASEYVKQGLVAHGVAAAKITVIPYPIDTKPNTHRIDGGDRAERRDGPVVVGFVGGVNLRKGAPWFFQVARRFDPRQVRFVMVGPVGLAPEIVEQHRGEVELAGAVPRSEVSRRLAGFDVYFFPTTCEGSATSLMEAMAAGLPVVTTPNSGTVARHGEEGFITHDDDVDGFEQAIRQLAADAELRREMGAAARRRVETFDLDWYSGQLGALYQRLITQRA